MADALSRTPVYFDYDQDKSQTLDFDSVRNLYLYEGADTDSEYCRRLDDFSIEVLQEAPEIKNIENSGKSCPDYTAILEAVRGGKRPKDLPQDSEACEMSGEWDRLNLMPRKNIIMLEQDWIFVPKLYRKKLIENLHANTHRKCDTMWATLRSHFHWPRMKKMIKELSESCQTCLAFEPCKDRAKPAGMEVKFDTLSLMD